LRGGERAGDAQAACEAGGEPAEQLGGFGVPERPQRRDDRAAAAEEERLREAHRAVASEHRSRRAAARRQHDDGAAEIEVDDLAELE